MKTNLLKISLLLTGILYLTATLELDSEEREQHYEKENHSYIVKSQHHFDLHIEQIADIPQIIIHNFGSQKLIIADKSCETVLSDYSPPNRIYLQICSFLI
jgi:hypothetical protein